MEVNDTVPNDNVPSWNVGALYSVLIGAGYTLGLSLLLAQSILTAGGPAANKFTEDYTKEQPVESKALLAFLPLSVLISSTLANMFFSASLLKSPGEEFSRVARAFNSKINLINLGHLIHHTLAYAAASVTAQFDGSYAKNVLIEWGVTKQAEDNQKPELSEMGQLFFGLSILSMVLIYKQSIINSDKELFKIAKGIHRNGLNISAKGGVFAASAGLVTFGKALAVYNVLAEDGFSSSINTIAAFTVFSLLVSSFTGLYNNFFNKDPERYGNLEENNNASTSILSSSVSNKKMAGIFALSVMAASCVVLNAIANGILANNSKERDPFINALCVATSTLASGVLCGAGAAEKIQKRFFPKTTVREVTAEPANQVRDNALL